MFTKYASALLLVLAICACRVDGQPAPVTAATFSEQLDQLSPKNDKATRLEVLKWLSAHSGSKHAAVAIPALERCIREDRDGEIRRHAVRDLYQIAHRLQHPCPLALIEALTDDVDLVRWEAAVAAGLFKTFAAGSVEVLLRGVKSDKAELRSTCLDFAARAGGKDRRVLDALELARQDRVFDVRHSAHAALFVARDNLEEYLRYVVRLREDPAAVLAPVPDDAAVAKTERMQRNLFMIGSGVQVIEWSETRADEFGELLARLLQHDSPVMRRGAANLIGAAAGKVDLKKRRPGDPLGFAGSQEDALLNAILPYIEQPYDPKLKKEALPKPRPEKSKVALRLEKIGVETTLRKIRDDDPDRSVREAARFALERLAKAGDDPARAEMKKLEGTWQLMSAVKDGKATPDDVVKKIRVVIKDGKHTVYFEENAVAKEIPFTIDPTKTPKTTVDKLPDGKEVKGIYKLDGDTLTSCVAEAGKDRPTEFASRPGSGHTLRVFRRAKP